MNSHYPAIYRCFIASPMDTLKEREACDKVFSEINHSIGQHHNFRIESRKWEMDTHPGFGIDAQDVINKQIGNEYEIFIGIMWKSFGSPTLRFDSGTEEEFENAYKRLTNKEPIEILFYFNNASINISEINAEQVLKIQKFKEKVSTRGGYYNIYDGVEDFEQKLRQHISSYLLKHIDEKTNSVFNDLKENILDPSIQEDLSELEGIPRSNYIQTAYHQNIRLVEQERFIEKIKKYKYTWLITDWSLNEAGFIGSVLEKLNLNLNNDHFVINCEDLVEGNTIPEAIKAQFHISLQKFCGFLNHLDNSLLVLNHLNSSFYELPSNYFKIEELIKTIIDYCPKIYIVIVARQIPTHIRNDNFTRLTTLDILQIKEYLFNHPKADKALLNGESLKKINLLTSGLPNHLDRVIEMLQVTDLEEIFELELEQTSLSNEDNPIPKSLKNAIDKLSISINNEERRSFQLLKILTILENGETFSNIRRFNFNEPFYPSNASELEQLSLLEVTPINRLITRVASSEQTQNIKLLKVPRQVRDYVNTLINEIEKNEIIKRGCEIYLGPNWRESKFKNNNINSITSNKEYLNFENCHIVTKNLLFSALKSGIELEITRSANICIAYCEKLLNATDYKNAQIACEEIYYLLKSSNLLRQRLHVIKIYGQSLRMNEQTEKALEILKEGLSLDRGMFSKNDKVRIYNEIAFIYEYSGNMQMAESYAKKIKEIADENSNSMFVADIILAKKNLSGEFLTKRLKSLESKSRKLKLQAANNIALDLSDLEDIPIETKLKYLSKVIDEGSQYNKMRAMVRKGVILVDSEQIQMIPNDDLIRLSYIYTYLYHQKLTNMFIECHFVLWSYLVSTNNFSELLNLFKYSSFYWRIYDHMDYEKQCFDDLIENSGFNLESISLDSFNRANVNYFNRRRIDFESKFV